MSKVYALCLVLFLTVSCLLIENTGASYAKPSVPEFTINDNTVTIKNQPFTPYYDSSENKTIDLYYEIQTKYHNSDEWVSLERFWVKDAPTLYQKRPYQQQDDSAQYTTLKFLSNEGREDFQVRALIGYVSASGGHVFDFHNEMTAYSFTGEYGEWSSTQTIGTTDNTQSHAPTIMPTPRATTQPTQAPKTTLSPQYTQTSQPFDIPWETAAIVGLVVAVVVLAVGLGVVWRRLNSIKGSTLG
jgi:hypothetical protein